MKDWNGKQLYVLKYVWYGCRAFLKMWFKNFMNAWQLELYLTNSTEQQEKIGSITD